MLNVCIYIYIYIYIQRHKKTSVWKIYEVCFEMHSGEYQVSYKLAQEFKIIREIYRQNGNHIGLILV
jgi:hypothetical protein